MNTDVRYATTTDGVRIGYSVSGSGPVLISMPDIGFSSMLLAERDLPELAAWAEALSSHFTYVRYDARGFGVSQREVDDISIDTWSLDLDAVAAAIDQPAFVLFGYLGSSRLAITYAAEHPDRVTQVLTWGADYPIMASAEGEVLVALAKQDWDTFTETLAHIALGWDAGEKARLLAAFWRRTTSQPLYLQFLEQFHWPTDEEMQALGASMTVPSLAMARRHKYSAPRITAMADDPHARLRILPGEEAMPFEGDMGLVIRNILAFVAGGLVAEEPPPNGNRGGVHAVPTPSRMLSERELEVLKLVAAAKSNGEIAEELVLSVRTVERHLMRIYDKLGATGKSARVVAAAYASQEASPP